MRVNDGFKWKFVFKAMAVRMFQYIDKEILLDTLSRLEKQFIASEEG